MKALIVIFLSSTLFTGCMSERVISKPDVRVTRTDEPSVPPRSTHPNAGVDTFHDHRTNAPLLSTPPPRSIHPNAGTVTHFDHRTGI